MVAPHNLFIEFMHKVEGAKRDQTPHKENVESLCSLLKIWNMLDWMEESR